MKPYIFLTQGFDSPPASNIFKIFFLVKIISIFNYVVICHPACEGAGGVFFNGVGSRGTLAAGATATATLM